MGILSIQEAYSISVSILLFSTLISSLELMCVPKLFINFVYPSTSISYKNYLWISVHCVQLILSVFTFISFYFGYIVIYKVLFVTLTTAIFYSYRIRTVGKDGSDQMRLLSMLSFSVCFLLEDNYYKLVPMLFVGVQTLIAYATSGLIKATSSYWRKGNVLSGIFQTYSYGIPKFAQMLREKPRVEKLMSYSAIATMLAVPFTFLIPFQEPIIAALVMMFGFHFFTAVLMGLNDFLYTFPLTYPGILLLHSFIYNY